MPSFTPRAQQVLALARKEADRFNHNFVGTEHVLLGILKLGQGTAATALMNMGLDLENVRAEVEKQVGTGPDQKMIGNIPFTPRVKKVLALAAKEAKALDHTYVGTEHILLGLLREGDGVAARVLKNLHVDIERARAEVLNVCEAPTLTKGPPAPIPKDFTPRAQQALLIAEEESRRLNLGYIGTEHALLALIRLRQGVAVTVLAKLGFDENTVRAEVDALASRHPAEASPIPVDYSAPMNEALAFASEEAQRLHHTYIATEHLLLALLRQKDGGAVQIFKKLNLYTEGARREILQELDPGIPATPVPSPNPEPAIDRSELPRERFTPRVRRAFTLARDEAEKLNHPLVETEHVLLGLIRMGQGVAASVLIKIGVNAEAVAARLDPPQPGRAATKAAEPPHFSALVKELLAFADEEARALEHTYIGTEHILLALLRQPHSGAARIFDELYVDAEALRQQVLLAFEVKTVTPKFQSSGGIAMQPSEKDTEMYARKTSPGNPASAAAPRFKPAKAPRESVSTEQRYDVYCVERNQKVVVYRNVRFKAVKGLFPRNDFDQWSDFVELEQPDGQTFFVSKSMITRFCAPGAKPEIENL